MIKGTLVFALIINCTHPTILAEPIEAITSGPTPSQRTNTKAGLDYTCFSRRVFVCVWICSATSKGEATDTCG